MTAEWEKSGQAIVHRYSVYPDDDLPLHLRLKKVIIELIESGEFPVRTKLPPEQWLARHAGISLGTVQRTLGALQSEERLQRKQGHGTFVSAPRQPMTELWHYRFIEPETGAYVPVYSHLISRSIRARNTAAATVLGDDPKGYLEIVRRIYVGDEVSCYSRLYLGASHFAPLLDADASIFENVNLKSIFAAQFGRPTHDVTQRVHLAEAPAPARKALGLAAGSPALILTMIAMSNARPYSFQEAVIPPMRFQLVVGGQA